MNTFTFAVIGGDRRSFYAAKRLKEHGFETKLLGLKNEKPFCPLEKTEAEAVLLPVPFTRDGIHLFAPESTEKILISDVLASIPENSMIFAGNASNITDDRILDYAKKEVFALMNAIPTAEGALLLALQNGKRTVFGMRVAVIGYGKVAFATAKLFYAVGADVTVFARDEIQLLKANLSGISSHNISELCNFAPDFDVIIHTVPFIIVDSKAIKNSNYSCVFIAFFLTTK